MKIITAIALLLLTACSESEDVTPQAQIKAIIEQVEEGVEQRSLSQVLNNISETYSDHKGRTKKDIARMTQLQILRNENIHILTRIKFIDVVDSYASVELSSAMTSRALDLNIEANRLKADSYKVSIAFKKEPDQWRIVSTSWQRGW